MYLGDKNMHSAAAQIEFELKQEIARQAAIGDCDAKLRIKLLKQALKANAKVLANYDKAMGF
jgi:hypothetical protein